VGHEHDQTGILLVQLYQQGLCIGAGLRVERTEGFVHQQDARLQDQGARQRHALVLAAGKLCRTMIAMARQADRFEHRIDARCPFAARHLALPARETERERDVFPHRQVGPVGVTLKHHHGVVVRLMAGRTVDQHRARSRGRDADRSHTAHHVQQGGLAAARRAQQHVDAGSLEVQIDAIQDPQHAAIAVALGIFLHDLAQLDADARSRSAHSCVSQGYSRRLAHCISW
jgi:hypothetical protein